VVFACDMYGEGVTGNRERIMRHIGALRTSRGAIVRRVQAASEILLSRPEIDGRMAAVGYCFGGMIVLEYARSGSTISAVVSVHGSLQSGRPILAVPPVHDGLLVPLSPHERVANSIFRTPGSREMTEG
jgi:dienelactone hydrolase